MNVPTDRAPGEAMAPYRQANGPIRRGASSNSGHGSSLFLGDAPAAREQMSH